MPGYNLMISLDSNIQTYAQQAALKVMEEKQADRVSILLMNPQNGEIYAMVNVPEFDLNDPFTLNEEIDTSGMSEKEKQDLLNQMWRNPCLNDTYEPGSTFKIITMSAGLEEKWYPWTINSIVPATEWWKTGESTAATEGDTGPKIF